MNAMFRKSALSYGFLATAASVASACNLAVGGPAVELPTGVKNVVIDMDELQLPPELAGAEIASIPCADDSGCPSTDLLTTLCVATVCDPEPYRIEGPLGESVDLQELAEVANSPIAKIDSVQITSATFQIDTNTLNLALPEVELFWGPADRSEIDADSVFLGSLPSVAPGETRSGDLPLDSAGLAALSQQLLDAGQARFFARTAIDLEPGQTTPTGRVELMIQLRIRIQGSLSI